MAHLDPLQDKLVVLIGGGGLLGTHVAECLLERGARVRVAERDPGNAYRLRPLADLGQIQFMRADVRHKGSLDAAIAGAHAVVYLVGSFGADQQAVQADGAGLAARSAAEAGAKAFVYLSAIGADVRSESGYAATKGQGEQRVLAAFPQATILRPSVLFGEDDKFLNLFAGLIAGLPVVPVFGSEARLQPLFVDDAAEAVAEALSDPFEHGGKTYELAGPEVVTMGELHQRLNTAQGRTRHLLPVPDGLSAVFAALPGTPMNSDQWLLLKRGTVAGGDLPGIGALGIQPRPLGLYLDRWMVRYRKAGRFGEAKSAV
jgi:NADH dehydrogenase